MLIPGDREAAALMNDFCAAASRRGTPAAITALERSYLVSFPGKPGAAQIMTATQMRSTLRAWAADNSTMQLVEGLNS